MKFTYTARVKAAMEGAREEAVRLGHDYTGTEHLLLGLLRDGQNRAIQVLTDLGVDLGTLKHSIEDYVSKPGVGGEAPEGPEFAPRAKQSVEMAAREAKALGTRDVGVEHLLLALLIDREGVAAQVLARSGVEYEAALAALRTTEG